MAKTAANKNIEGQFTKEQLREKHEAHLAQITALAERATNKNKANQAAKTQAETNYKKNPTIKNYRLWTTAIVRAI
jgi:hypothetical protein